MPFSFQVYQLTIYNHNKTFVLSNLELLSPLVLCSNPSDGLGLTSIHVERVALAVNWIFMALT